MKFLRLLFIVLIASVATIASPVAEAATPNVPGLAVTPALSAPAAGNEHTCIIRDGNVWCTGSNSRGQLGNGTTTKSIAFAPSLMTNAVQLSANTHSTCAVRSDATLWCWGQIISSIDPLTIPPAVVRIDSPMPVQIPLTGVKSVAVGANHSCAILLDRSLWCWGVGTSGQLGDGAKTSAFIPVRAAIDSVISADVGLAHTCAVRSTGSVWCWGSNQYRRLGLRSSASKSTPTYVPRVRATLVTTGDSFTCIASTTKRIQCWGRNNYSQLGLTSGPSRYTPVTIRVKSPIALSAGSEFACALTEAGTTWCWGRNRFGQLANGTTIRKASPQKVIASPSVGTLTSLTTGSSHACGISSVSSGMWCWGLGLNGQLGDSGGGNRTRGTAVWQNGVRLKSIGTDLSARVVIVGDISCDTARRTRFGIGPLGTQCGEVSTALLTTSLVPEGVIALGDLQYESASAAEIAAFYEPTWGRFKNITYPVRGNHEYITGGAAGYVDYFSEMSPSYWTTDAGGWRIIAVDSWCQGLLFAGCSATSPQTQWLQAELLRAKTDGRCAAVMMHHPLVSSGRFATSTVRPLWEASVAGGADVVFTAHDHHYERFEPLGPSGTPTVGGVPLFITGLGGAPAYPLDTPVPGSQFRTNAEHGVMNVTFTPTSFTWSFVSAVNNLAYDQGSAPCTP
jgi:alpha-tubulin suppressor-like RCC1 family protein